MGRAVGFQALRSPAAPLSRGQLGYCSSTQGGPQASGRGKRGPAAFALPRVCPGTLPAATLQGCGQARCLAKAGGGVLPRPYAVTPRSQSRLLAPPRFWAPFFVSFPLASSPIPGGCTPASTLVQGSRWRPHTPAAVCPPSPHPKLPFECWPDVPSSAPPGTGCLFGAEPHLWAWLWC